MAYSNKKAKKFEVLNANGIYIKVWAIDYPTAIAWAKTVTSNEMAVNKKERV